MTVPRLSSVETMMANDEASRALGIELIDQGELLLEDAEPIGARVKLVFIAESRGAVRPGASEAGLDLSAVAHGA